MEGDRNNGNVDGNNHGNSNGYNGNKDNQKIPDVSLCRSVRLVSNANVTHLGALPNKSPECLVLTGEVNPNLCTNMFLFLRNATPMDSTNRMAETLE